MKPLSIQTRLTIWFATASAAVLCAVAVGILVVEREVLERRAENYLRDSLKEISERIRLNPGDLTQPGQEGLVHAYAAWSEDGSLLHRSPGWLHFNLPDRQIAGGLHEIDSHIVRVRYGSVETPQGRIVIGVADDETTGHDALQLLADLILASSPLVAIATLSMGWIVAGRALRPVRQLGKDLERITTDRPDERVQVGRSGDEFDKLSITLNATLARLQKAIGTQRRFAADASHQLRTPLAAQRAIGEAALVRHPDEAEQLAEAIASMLEESQRLADLTAGLLELARTENARPDLAPLDLLSHTREVINRLEPLAESSGHIISLTGTPAQVMSSAGDFARTLTGILENAIVHTPPDTHIDLSVHIDATEIRLEVRDDGPGIDPAEAEAIFEPFHRGSRSMTKPGSGLGLALARASAAAAGARLTLVSASPAVFCLAFQRADWAD